MEHTKKNNKEYQHIKKFTKPTKIASNLMHHPADSNPPSGNSW